MYMSLFYWVQYTNYSYCDSRDGTSESAAGKTIHFKLFSFIQISVYVEHYIYKSEDTWKVCVFVCPDRLSSSPWPSWPSDPRPQLQTSVSRDGSLSPASSSAAAWVWPLDAGLQAHVRRGRGDPDRKTCNIKETGNSAVSPLRAITYWVLLRINHKCKCSWSVRKNITATTNRGKRQHVPWSNKDTVNQVKSVWANIYTAQTGLVWTHPIDYL